MCALDGWTVLGQEPQLPVPQLHVMPVNDCRMHIHSVHCTCGPQVMEADDEDPERAQIIVHNAFDGRHHYETRTH